MSVTATSLEHPVIHAIRERRSHRKYIPTKISRDDLETIIDCGRLAPTANNMQTWEFVAVTNPETLAQISTMATYGKFIADAAACIIVCGDLSGNRSLYLDGSAATENMLLAICALGYASCWVQGFEKEYNEPIKKLLGIPENLKLVSIIPVGKAAGEVSTPRKRPLNEVLHWEKF